MHVNIDLSEHGCIFSLPYTMYMDILYADIAQLKATAGDPLIVDDDLLSTAESECMYQRLIHVNSDSELTTN